MAHSIILILRIRRMDCQTKQFGWRVVDVVKAGLVVPKREETNYRRTNKQDSREFRPECVYRYRIAA